MRRSRPFTALSIFVLALISLGHLLRIVFQLEAVINGMTVPVWVSAFPALFFGWLAWMLWRESGKDGSQNS